MKKSLILLFIANIFLSSCLNKEKIIADIIDKNAGTSNDKGNYNQLSHLPSWVINPSIKDSIAAVGIASKSRANIGFQISKAESNGRANIAAKINSEISRLTKNAFRESILNDENDMENITSQVTKDIVREVPLQGVERINIYQDANDGTIYVHMAINNDMIVKYFENNKKLISAQLKKSMTEERLNNAEENMKKLYEELNQELNQESE